MGASEAKVSFAHESDRSAASSTRQSSAGVLGLTQQEHRLRPRQTSGCYGHLFEDPAGDLERMGKVQRDLLAA
jgi:hypothetical protein